MVESLLCIGAGAGEIKTRLRNPGLDYSSDRSWLTTVRSVGMA